MFWLLLRSGGWKDGWVGGWVRVEGRQAVGRVKSNNTACRSLESRQTPSGPLPPPPPHLSAGKPAIYSHGQVAQNCTYILSISYRLILRHNNISGGGWAGGANIAPGAAISALWVSEPVASVWRILCPALALTFAVARVQNKEESCETQVSSWQKPNCFYCSR